MIIMKTNLVTFFNTRFYNQKFQQVIQEYLYITTDIPYVDKYFSSIN